jgi:LysM repeat protein
MGIPEEDFHLSPQSTRLKPKLRTLQPTMNTQSPLVPQGSMLEQKNKGRARVKIAVFFVLAIHGIGLLALLLQGCQRDKTTAQNETATNSVSTFEPTTMPVDSNATPTAVASVSNTSTAAVPPGTATTTTGAADTSATAAAPGTASEYAIAKNDTLGGIAKNFHVTVKSIMDANPGIEPTRLKIAQKIHIPAPTAAMVSAASTKAVPATDATGGNVYSVKSGDTLTTIAKHEGTTIKELRAANNLKSDRIIVGQKLKIPGRGNTASGATTAPLASPAAAADAPVVTATNVGGNR